MVGGRAVEKYLPAGGTRFPTREEATERAVGVLRVALEHVPRHRVRR